MNSENFNYASVMGVIGATKQDDRGVFIPGELMPSGRAVRGDGATIEDIMTDRSIAETWTDSVRVTYEREKAERDHESGTRDTPELVIQRADAPPERSGGSEGPVEMGFSALEAELQARQKFWSDRADELGPQLTEAEAQLAKVEAALDAIGS